MTAAQRREELMARWQVVQHRWEDVSENWRDRVRRRFEEEIWRDFERNVPDAVERMESLSRTIKNIRTRLES